MKLLFSSVLTQMLNDSSVLTPMVAKQKLHPFHTIIAVSRKVMLLSELFYTTKCTYISEYESTKPM